MKRQRILPTGTKKAAAVATAVSKRNYLSTGSPPSPSERAGVRSPYLRLMLQPIDFVAAGSAGLPAIMASIALLM